MKKTHLLKILATLFVAILGLFAFYKFMTYDRNYSWSKQFEYDVRNLSKSYGFVVVKTNKISTDSINLSTEKSIKISLQKALNKINLMNYGKEYGESISLESKYSKARINCKAWCLGDHVIGIEIEYNEVDVNTLNNFKKAFENKFDNYKILWAKSN